MVRVAKLGRDHEIHVLAERLLLRVAEHLLAGPVPGPHYAVGIDDDDRVGGAVECPARDLPAQHAVDIRPIAQGVTIATVRTGVQSGGRLVGMTIEISPARADERDAVVALWHDSGLTRPWDDPTQDLERARTGPSSTVLAARADGVLVGAAMVGHDGHRAWVYYVAATPERRGEGIGQALMAAAEDWARERFIPKIQFLVRDDSPEALEFYSHLGYEKQAVTVLGRRLD